MRGGTKHIDCEPPRIERPTSSPSTKVSPGRYIQIEGGFLTTTLD